MTDSLVQSTTFATADFASRDRFDVWRSLLGATHDVDGASGDFSGRVVSAAVDRLVARTMHADPQSVSRTPQRCRRDGIDHITLHLTTTPLDFETASGRYHVDAGSITVNTLARPFKRAKAAENGSSILTLSRDLVTEFVSDPEAFHGTVLTGGSGAIFAAHMSTLCAQAHRIHLAEAPTIARATAQLLAASLVPTQKTLAEARPAAEAAALVRCKAYVERNLQEPDLSPEAICRNVGLSRSTLYRLFQPSGGAAAYIRERRLSAVARALSDPAGRPRIADVAYAFGFSNLSTFNRLFRGAYGMAPSDMAKAGPLHVPSSRHDWLQSFR